MVILALGLRTARAISTHADRCLSVAWRAPGRRLPLSGIGPANDLPIARRRVARRQAEQFFERRMPVKAAIVAKDEFVEICIDMLAAQAVIRAQSPPLHQREDPVNPGQHCVSGHFADHARIMPIIGQARIG